MSYFKRQELFIFLVSLFVSSCITPKGVFYKNFDPRKINIISVGEIKPFAQYNVSGEMIRDLIIQNLLARNFTVKEENSSDVEYVLLGSVTKFLPEKKFLVYTGTEKQQVMVGGPLTEISGSNVYNIGSAFGVPDGEVVVTNATVGVSVRLVEKHTGNIVWSSSFVYEALTSETAAGIVTNYLVTALTGIKK
jgi:hypothetical protein